MSFKGFLFCGILTFIFVTACGGGGGSEPSNVPLNLPPPIVNPNLPPPTPKFAFTVSAFAVESSTIAFSIQESVLQIGLEAQDLLTNVQQNIEQADCFTYVHNDEDSSNSLSAGDTLRINYNTCYRFPYRDIVSGEAIITVNSYDSESLNFNVNIDLSKVKISPENINFLGEFNIDKTGEPSLFTYVIRSNSPLDISFNGELIVGVTELTSQKTFNFNNAQYSQTSAGELTIYLEDGNGVFSFKQDKAWRGYFNETPFEGELHLSTNDVDVVEMKVDPSAYDSVAVDDGIQSLSYLWTEFAEGAIWGFDLDYPASPIPYSESNLAFIGVLNNIDADNFSPTGEIELLLSREIDDLSAADIFFAPATLDIPIVNANSIMDGNRLIVRPSKPLFLGGEYRLILNDIASATSLVTYISSNVVVNISEDLLPVITPTSNMFGVNDFPSLSALNSLTNTSQIAEYQWSTNHPNIVFSDPQRVETEMFQSGNVDSNFSVVLTITNSNGDMASASININYVPSKLDVLAFFFNRSSARPFGENVVYTSLDYELFPSTSASGDYIDFSSFTSPYGSIIINSMNGTKFVPGVYSIFEDNSNGYSINFTVDGLSCFNGDGTIEILEIAYDAQNRIVALAANTSLLCQGVLGPMQGTIRYNTSVLLNE